MATGIISVSLSTSKQHIIILHRSAKSTPTETTDMEVRNPRNYTSFHFIVHEICILSRITNGKEDGNYTSN